MEEQFRPKERVGGSSPSRGTAIPVGYSGRCAKQGSRDPRGDLRRTPIWIDEEEGDGRDSKPGDDYDEADRDRPLDRAQAELRHDFLKPAPSPFASDCSEQQENQAR